MSVETEINSIIDNIKADYDSLANLGETAEDKNIENIATLVDNIYNKLPKTSYGEGTDVSLSPTIKAKLDFDKEYQQVEYIEGSGTQYITTNYKLGNNTAEIKTKVYIPNMLDAENDIVGNQDLTTNRFVLGIYNKKVFGYSRSADTQDDNVITSAYSGSQTLEIDLNFNANNHTKTLNVNGTTSSNTYNASISSTTTNTQVFANGGATNCFIGKIYYLKIYENNVLKLNLIPCYRISDNVIGMYDIVNNKFYTNSGTGTFKKGADIKGINDKVLEGNTSQETTQGYNILEIKAPVGTYEKAGITWTVNADKSITANGTATANSALVISNESMSLNEYSTELFTFESAFYQIPGVDNNTVGMYYRGTNGNYISTAANAYGKSIGVVYLQVYNGKTVNNVTVRPMIVNGSSTERPYEKYTGNAPSPSPSYPQEVKVVRGKNICNLSIVGQVPSVTNGQLVDSSTGACTDYIDIDNAEHYMLSFGGLAYMYVFLYGADKTYIGYQQYASGSYDISTIANYNQAKYIRVRTDNKNVSTNVQLEERKCSYSLSSL